MPKKTHAVNDTERYINWLSDLAGVLDEISNQVDCEVDEAIDRAKGYVMDDYILDLDEAKNRYRDFLIKNVTERIKAT